jgi:hypothetical protein
MKTKTITFPRTFASYQTKDLLWTASLVLSAVIAPALLAHTPHNQWITGTLVNAFVLIAAYRLGIINATLVAALPSTVALLRGLLPAPLAMLIPYIIISNIILAASFWMFKKTPVMGLAIAGIAKFAFLYSITLIFASKIASPLLVMFSWPQLFTALAGGILALSFIKLEKIGKRETSSR